MSEKRLTGDALAIAYKAFLNATLSGPPFRVESVGGGWLKVRRVRSITDGARIRASEALKRMEGQEPR